MSKEELLEEKFEKLRAQGMTDEEIIRQIFNEDLNADVQTICRITGLDSLTVGRIKGQVARWKKPKKQEAEKEEEEEEEEEPLPEPETTKMSPREYVALYGPEGLEKLKKQRLFQFLRAAPGVSKKVAKWILQQWDVDPNVRKDPNALYSLLTSSGVRDRIAYRICNALIALESEVQAQPQPPILFPTQTPQYQSAPYWPPQPQTSQPFYYPPRPTWTPQPQLGTYYGYTPTYPYQPLPPYPPTYKEQKVDPDEIANKVLQKLREETREGEEERTLVTITEPIRDAEGKILKDEKGRVVYRILKVPPSQVANLTTEDPEMLFLQKGRMWRDLLFPKEAETKEDPRIKILENELKETRKTLEALQNQLSEREKQEMRARIDRLEKELAEARSEKVVEGYQSDAYRFLGQGLKEVATVAREKRPVEMIIKFLAQPSAQPKEVEAGAREGVVERLPESWVIEE